MTKPGDVDHFTRVRCYEAVLDKYPAATTTMSLLNLAMRMAGPREAVWHGLIRANHGCTHFIVGRDHAGPGRDTSGENFYGTYDAQDLFKQHEAEMGIKMVDFKQMLYVEERAQYYPANELPKDATVLDISGTEMRRRLREGWIFQIGLAFRRWLKNCAEQSLAEVNKVLLFFLLGFQDQGSRPLQMP